jgi:hypothetical protein
MADDPKRPSCWGLIGGFILITLICLFCLAAFEFMISVPKLKNEVNRLSFDVEELKKSIDAQSNEIKMLRESLPKGKGKE